MTMHNPPHPGEFIREVYMTPYGLSSREIAKKLGVNPSTFTRLLNGLNNLSPEMALRLSKVLGRSPESWLQMQDNYSLWLARQKLDLTGLEKMEFVEAEN
jgi:antitoxin HigA-1